MSAKCEHCQAWRARLYVCHICGQRLCGCCSIKSQLNGVRLCCYPGDHDCVTRNAARVRGTTEENPV